MRKQILDRFLILGMCGLPCQWPGNIACMPLRIFYSERMEVHVLSKGENDLNGRQAVSRFSVKVDQEIEPKSGERRGAREIATPFNFCQRVRIDCDCLFNFRTKIRWYLDSRAAQSVVINAVAGRNAARDLIGQLVCGNEIWSLMRPIGHPFSFFGYRLLLSMIVEAGWYYSHPSILPILCPIFCDSKLWPTIFRSVIAFGLCSWWSSIQGYCKY